jgi:hypothetical protein
VEADQDRPDSSREGDKPEPMKRVAEWIVKRRFPISIGVLLLTAFFGFHSLKIEMYTAFSDLVPTDHPFIKVHNEFSKIFGGANLVLLAVEVKEGNIFNPRTLAKIKKLTEMLELTRGASNYQIFSIARQKVKDVRATSWGIEVQPIMWPNVPQIEEDLERLQNAIYANPTIAGRLVSMDGKAALITAAFHEERLDYAALFRRIQSAIREVEDKNTKVYAAGEPPIVAADGRTLARAVRVAAQVEPIFVAEMANLAASVLAAVQAGDVVITMGAGSVGGVAARIVELAQGVAQRGRGGDA